MPPATFDLFIDHGVVIPDSVESDLDRAIETIEALNAASILLDDVAQKFQSIVGKLPIPRGASPVETAKAYMYFMLNDYATGQTLPVEGGGSLL